MSTQVDDIPSAVLIESYNERMRKFLVDYPTPDIDITVGETDSEGVAEATIILNGKNSLTTKVNRLKLEETLSLTPEIGGELFLRLLDNGAPGFDDAKTAVLGAIGIHSAGDIELLPLEDQTHLERTSLVSAITWSNDQLFLPPTDFTIDDLSNEPPFIDYIAENDNVQAVFKFEAKPTSLAYVGSVNVLHLTKDAPTPPPPVYKLDLSEITNSDAPGTWALTVDTDADVVPEVGVLTELVLSAINSAHDITITSADVTPLLSAKTLTLSAIKGNVSEITGTLTVEITLNVTPPPIVKFDLSTLTNNETPGTWSHELESVNDFDTQKDIIVDQIVTAADEAASETITLSDFKVVFTKPTGITITPSVGVGDVKLIGQVEVTVTAKPEPIVKFDLGSVTNNVTPGSWTIDATELEYASMSAESVTQAMLEVINLEIEPPITYDQLDAIKLDKVVTVNPGELGEATIEGTVTITINVIPDEVEERVVVDLSVLTNCDNPGFWEYAVLDVNDTYEDEPNIIAEVIEYIATVSEVPVIASDLNVYTDSTNGMFMSSSSFEEDTPVEGLLKITLIIKPVTDEGALNLNAQTNESNPGFFTVTSEQTSIDEEIDTDILVQLIIDELNRANEIDLVLADFSVSLDSPHITITPAIPGDDKVYGSAIITITFTDE